MRPQFRQAGNDVRPGVELVPGEDQRVPRHLVGLVEPEAGEDAFQISAMHHIEPGEGLAPGSYFLHTRLVFAAPGIGKRGPVEVEAPGAEHRARLPRHAGAPVDEGAEHVEEQRPRFCGHALFLPFRGARVEARDAGRSQSGRRAPCLASGGVAVAQRAALRTTVQGPSRLLP